MSRGSPTIKIMSKEIRVFAVSLGIVTYVHWERFVTLSQQPLLFQDKMGVPASLLGDGSLT
ncbi:MAG: hypothetical protein JRC86_00700 [Deltaproteobacteria bacterium]|nr:hypothetical protein [Deltaproteobacteria bacterium]